MDTPETVILSLNRTLNYLYWAAATAVVYDHVTTLGLEFRFMWKKWTFLEFLFISNRYIGTTLAIVNLLSPSLTKVFITVTYKVSLRPDLILDHWVKQRYLPTAHFVEWATYYVIWTMQGIMQYRIYAMYQNSRKVLIFLVSGFIMEVVSMLIILITFTVELGLAITAFVENDVMLCINPLAQSRYAIYIPTIVYESVLFGFALWAGIRFYNGRRDRYTSEMQTTPLAFILMRDSIVFPFITVIICLAYTITIRSDSVTMPSQSDYVSMNVTQLLPGIVCRILGSRLVLHLREAFYLPFTGEMGQATRLEDDE